MAVGALRRVPSTLTLELKVNKYVFIWKKDQFVTEEQDKLQDQQCINTQTCAEAVRSPNQRQIKFFPSALFPASNQAVLLFTQNDAITVSRRAGSRRPVIPVRWSLSHTDDTRVCVVCIRPRYTDSFHSSRFGDLATVSHLFRSCCRYLSLKKPKSTAGEKKGLDDCVKGPLGPSSEEHEEVQIFESSIVRWVDGKSWSS